MRNIVVLGCGFAGYHAARRLESELAGRRRVRLTVVTRRAHFIFTPLLTNVASGELEPDHIVTPIHEAFELRTRVVIDEIESIDWAERRLIGTQEEIPFDYLLIATGAAADQEVFEGAASVIGPHTLTDAITMRQGLDALTDNAEQPPRLAILGASSTGVEWAGELATALIQDFDLDPRLGEVDLQLYDAGSRLLPDHSPSIAGFAQQILDELGVEVHLNSPVTAVNDGILSLADGTSLPVDRVYHCAGRRGIDLLQGGELEVDEFGRIVTADDLSVPGYFGVFAAGEAVVPTEAVPSRSNPQIALQQGQWAAKNLLADMSGRMRKPFLYEDRGDFLTVGRDHAILELRGLILEGRAAWLAYRLYYTALMPRSFQKARLLVDWVAGRIGGGDASSRGPRLKELETAPGDRGRAGTPED